MSKDNLNNVKIDSDSIHRRKILLEAGTVVAYERIPLKELCGMFLKYGLNTGYASLDLNYMGNFKDL